MSRLDLYLCYNVYDSSPFYIADSDELTHEAESFSGIDDSVDFDTDIESFYRSLMSEGRRRLPLHDCSKIAEGIWKASVVIANDDLCLLDPILYFIVRHSKFKFYGVFAADRTIIVPFYYSIIEFDEDNQLFYCYRIKKESIDWNRPEKKDCILHKRTIKGQLVIEEYIKDIIVSKDYDDFRSLSDGMCAVHRGSFVLAEGRGWGFVNPNGEEVIQCNYYDVSDFNNGFAIVYKKGDRFTPRIPVSYINKEGVAIFQRHMLDAQPFTDGFALVHLSEGWNYLKEDGTLLLKTSVCSAKPFNGDRTEIEVSRNAATNCTINKKGQVLFHNGEQEFWLEIDFNLFCEFGDFHEGFCVARGCNGLFGLINRKGEAVIQPRYRRISDYENGLATVLWEGKVRETYIWNKDGELQITRYAYGNECTIQYEMEINTKQEIVIRLSHGTTLNLSKDCLYAYTLTDTLVAVCRNNRFGVVNQFGEEILPCSYASLTMYAGIIRAYDYCEDTIDYDMSGNPIYPSELKSICINSRFESAMALRDVYCARKDGKWALLDSEGNQRTNFIYYKIRPFDNSVSNNKDLLEVEVRDDGYSRLGIITTDGEQILNCDYEYILSEDIPNSPYDIVYEDYNQYRYIARNGYDHFHDSSDGYGDRYAHGGVSSSKWSVFSLKHRKIIIDNYDCIIREGDFFLAGRDGHFLEKGQNGDIKGYSGVYDLFTLDGELLVGGFSQLSFAGKWLVLLYDVTWNEYSSEYGYEDFEMIVHGASRWLVMDSDLNLLCASILGEHTSIRKGTIIKISESVDEKGRKVHKYDYPSKYFFDSAPKWYDDVVSVTYKKSHYFIRGNDGQCSPGYAHIEPIDNKSLFFVYRNNNEKRSLGLFNIESFIEITRDCAAVTYPKGTVLFSIKESSEGLMTVEMVDITNGNSLEVIDGISKTDLHKILNESKLLILNEPQSTDDEIEILDASLFEESHSANFKERADSGQRQTEYWKTVDPVLSYTPVWDEDDEEAREDEKDSMSAYDNPYYNEGLDLDQQSEDFWNEY